MTRRPATPVLGRTLFGITLWRVTGQDGCHLSWGGPGDWVHLHKGGRQLGGLEYQGRAVGTVSGPCQDLATAQLAVDAHNHITAERTS